MTLNFTGLACQSSYSLAAAAVDQGGNVAESLAIAEASTPDVQWPVLVAGTPALRATSHGSMGLDVALSERGTVSVVVCSRYGSVMYMVQSIQRYVVCTWNIQNAAYVAWVLVNLPVCDRSAYTQFASSSPLLTLCNAGY